MLNESTFLDDPSSHRLADYLGVNRHKRREPNLARKIIFLHNNIGGDPFTSITKMRRSMGIQNRGKLLVDELFQFARLRQTREMVDKRIKAYGIEKKARRAKPALKPQPKPQQKVEAVTKPKVGMTTGQFLLNKIEAHKAKEAQIEAQLVEYGKVEK